MALTGLEQLLLIGQYLSDIPSGEPKFIALNDISIQSPSNIFYAVLPVSNGSPSGQSFPWRLSDMASLPDNAIIYVKGVMPNGIPSAYEMQITGAQLKAYYTGPLSSKYFTNDSNTDQYFTNDALTNAYNYSGSATAASVDVAWVDSTDSSSYPGSGTTMSSLIAVPADGTTTANNLVTLVSTPTYESGATPTPDFLLSGTNNFTLNTATLTTRSIIRNCHRSDTSGFWFSWSGTLPTSDIATKAILGNSTGASVAGVVVSIPASGSSGAGLLQFNQRDGSSVVSVNTLPVPRGVPVTIFMSWDGTKTVDNLRVAVNSNTFTTFSVPFAPLLSVAGAFAICGNSTVNKMPSGTTFRAFRYGNYFIDNSILSIKMAELSAKHQINYVPTVASVTSTQAVVYGWTPGGLIAACELSKNGYTVSWVSGRRDNVIGGMPTGGLSFQDAVQVSAFTGLSREFFTWNNYVQGQSDASIDRTAAPITWLQTALSMANNYGLNPIRTTGIASVTRSGTAVTSLMTNDGLTFSASVFVDASYEGDLIALSGIATTYGRDALDINNPSDGYKGAVISNADFTFNSVVIPVDPYENPGVPSSGVLRGVNTGPYPTVGAYDANTQAMAFRMNLRITAAPTAAFIPLSSTPPTTYNALNYELFGRYLAGLTAAGKVYGVDYTDAYFMIQTGVAGVLTDLNESSGAPIIDIPPAGPYDPVHGWMKGGCSEFLNATDARREQIWDEARDYIIGFFYWFQHSGDSRIPAAMVTRLRQYGYDSNSFRDPFGTDPAGFPYQFYVRAGRRMVSDFVIWASDVLATDGTVPRSTQTIAVGSYNIDSHWAECIIDSGVVRTEGSYGITLTGDQKFLLPMNVLIPKRTECTNVLPTFCISSSSEAFNAIRIEGTHMCIGQAVGAIAGYAITNGVALQDVPYTPIRTQLLAEGASPLPQIN